MSICNIEIKKESLIKFSWDIYTDCKKKFWKKIILKNLTILKKMEDYKLKKKSFNYSFLKKNFYQNIAEIFICKKKFIMKINYDWKVIKKRL